MRPLTFGNVAQIDDVQIIYVISMTSWRTKWDSNWRYNSENISLRCRPNFRSCAAKWPAEKNPLKGARISFAPQSHGPVLGQRNGTTIRFLISGHFECILRPLDGTKGAEITVLSADPSKDGPFDSSPRMPSGYKVPPSAPGTAAWASGNKRFADHPYIGCCIAAAFARRGPFVVTKNPVRMRKNYPWEDRPPLLDRPSDQVRQHHS